MFRLNHLVCSVLTYADLSIVISSSAAIFKLRDRDLDTFALAEGAFYHFGLLSRPTHSRALLNWALVLEHVRRDPDKAGERVDLRGIYQHIHVWLYIHADKGRSRGHRKP